VRGIIEGSKRPFFFHLADSSQQVYFKKGRLQPGAASNKRAVFMLNGPFTAAGFFINGLTKTYCEGNQCVDKK
jgi:hypothetical protein